MLTQDEVKKYAHMRRLKLVDQIWKDYLQDMLLHLLYRKIPNMIFSGGTAIWKIMKGNRFSEDIYGYVFSLKDIEGIEDYLKKEFGFLGINCKIIKSKKTFNMLFLNLALSFPSHHREITISLELLSARPEKTNHEMLYSPYPDIPPVEIVMLSPEEMLANKVSAIYKRNRARDVHDIYALLKLGTNIDMKDIKKKIPTFSLIAFRKKIMEKKALWKSLEPLMVTKLPEFKEEMEFILSCFESAAGKP